MKLRYLSILFLIPLFGCNLTSKDDAENSNTKNGVNFAEFPSSLRVFTNTEFSWYITNEEGLTGNIAFQWSFVPDSFSEFSSLDSAGYIIQTSDNLKSSCLVLPSETYLCGSEPFSSSAINTINIKDIRVPGDLKFTYSITIGNTEYSESKKIEIYDNKSPSVFASYELVSAGDKQIKLKMESTDSDGQVESYVAVLRSEYDNWVDSVSFTADEKVFSLPYKGDYTVDYYAIDNENYISDMRSLSFNIPQNSPVLDAEFYIDDQPVSADDLQGYSPAVLKIDLSSSTPGESADLQYYIDFGDGEKSYRQTATHTYDNEGSYTLTLAVKDDQVDGVTVSKTYDVNITTADAPTVHIGSNGSTFYLGDTLQLSANISADENVAIEDIEWYKASPTGDFRILAMGNDAQYYCNEFVGEGKIKLIVTDDKGNEVSKVFSFEVENRVPSLRYIVLDDKEYFPIEQEFFTSSLNFDLNYIYYTVGQKNDISNRGIYTFRLQDFEHKDENILNYLGNSCDYSEFKYTVVFYPNVGDEVVNSFAYTKNPEISIDCDQSGVYRLILSIRDNYGEYNNCYETKLELKF